MQMSKTSLYNDWIERQLRDERNEDVYEKRLTAVPPLSGFENTPRCIYFYYVRIDRSGMVRTDHYFYPNGPAESPEAWLPIPYEDLADPEGIVKRLALNARPSGKHDYKMDTNSFNGVKWEYPSYIVFFFDEKNWAFHQRNGGKPSVAFNVSEGHDPNRSFFDAKDLLIEMPVRRRNQPETTDQRTAIFMINHFKGGDDADLDSGGISKQRYKFDMYLQVKYAKSGAPAMTVIFDPDGTNQGPNT